MGHDSWQIQTLLWTNVWFFAAVLSSLYDTAVLLFRLCFHPDGRYCKRSSLRLIKYDAWECESTMSLCCSACSLRDVSALLGGFVQKFQRHLLLCASSLKSDVSFNHSLLLALVLPKIKCITGMWSIFKAALSVVCDEEEHLHQCLWEVVVLLYLYIHFY